MFSNPCYSLQQIMIAFLFSKSNLGLESILFLVLLLKKDVGGLVPMPVRAVAWVNLISAAPAKPELPLQTHPFVMKKERLKAYDLILPLKPLRACVIIRSAENICNFPSFVMFTLRKWTLICCNWKLSKTIIISMKGNTKRKDVLTVPSP